VWDDKKRAKKKRYAFLFNDILLLTKKEGSKRYWLRVYITLRSPYVHVEDASSGFNCTLLDNLAHELSPDSQALAAFRLHCKTRSFGFFTNSPEQNKGWMEDIADSASGAHEKVTPICQLRDSYIHLCLL